MGNVKILVVEDDSFLLQMYTTKLETENFEVLTALSGGEALRVVEKEHPALILLDLNLPEVDGFTVLEELKSKDETKDSELIFFMGKGCSHCANTGYKGRTSIVEAIEITRKLKAIISDGFNREAADKELAAQQFISMEQDGIIKSLLGMTTIEEVLRVGEEEQ